jgi:hypothetical protein
MTTLRRLATPLRLARARLARRLERVALVALGIAAGAAMLAAVLGGSLLARDRSLERATNRIAPADRAVRALWFGIPAQDASRQQLDGWALSALNRFGDVTRAMVYRETSVDGTLFDLAAVDGAHRFVRLTSGRLPRACTPSHCEVVQLAGTGPLPNLPGLRLVRVGRAKLSSDLPFGTILTSASTSALVRSAVAYHAPATPPFLLAEGVARTADIPALHFQYRSYAWVAALDPKRVHPWTAGRFGTDVEHARAELTSRSAQFDVTAPTQAVASALDESRIAGRRLLLIGGEAAALLLAFTVLAATRLRRDTDAAWRRLTWFGARRWQLFTLTAAEAATIALVGALSGWLVGCLVAIVAARKLGVDAGAILTHSTLSGSGLAVAIAVALVATVVLIIVLRAPSIPLGGFSFTAVDALALGALAAIGVGLARGGLDAQALAQGGGTGTFLILLPALIAFVAAVVTARLLSPLLRAAERRGRSAPIPARLAALSLARNPGYAAVAVTFLVVSLGLALFAQAYRETLAQGERAQADFAVPVDAIAREDLQTLVPVLDAAPLDAFARLGRAAPVVRLSGALAHVQAPFTAIGLPPNELAALRTHELARRITFAAPFNGLAVPADARTITLPVRVSGDPITVDASIRTPREDFVHVRLGVADGNATLRAAIPASARGGLFAGLTFGVTSSGLHGAANGGTGAQTIDRGRLTFGALRLGGRAYVLDNWVGVNGIEKRSDGIHYVVAPQLVSRFRAPQPTDRKPVPVLVTPRLAAAASPDGTLPIEIEGQRVVVHVAGTIARFPTANGDALVADGTAMTTALNAERPGSARTNEIWLSSQDPNALEAALARPPFSNLAIDSHARLERFLRNDPLARGSLLVLAGAAGIALALALVGIALGLVADVRDEHGELFDLESQGARPATLRRHLRLRALAVGAFGVAGGLVTGAILSALVVDLVVLTAAGGHPQPPLQLVIGWPVVTGGLVALLAVGGALVVAISNRAFHSPVAGRYTEVGG